MTATGERCVECDEAPCTCCAHGAAPGCCVQCSMAGRFIPTATPSGAEPTPPHPAASAVAVMWECVTCGGPVSRGDVFDDGTCRYCGGRSGVPSGEP